MLYFFFISCNRASAITTASSPPGGLFSSSSALALFGFGAADLGVIGFAVGLGEAADVELGCRGLGVVGAATAAAAVVVTAVSNLEMSLVRGEPLAFAAGEAALDAPARSVSRGVEVEGFGFDFDDGSAACCCCGGGSGADGLDGLGLGAFGSFISALTRPSRSGQDLCARNERTDESTSAPRCTTSWRTSSSATMA